MPAERQQARGAVQAANLPPALRAELLPALETLVQRHQPEGLYRPLVNEWQRIDNGGPAPRLLSEGGRA